MALFIQAVGGNTMSVTLSGVYSQADRDAVEAAGRAAIAKLGAINLLVVLKDFEGFARGVDWGNMDFYAEHADDIVKMAIVGDEKWKTDALAFTGSGTRRTQIQFFPMTAFGTALQWVQAS